MRIPHFSACASALALTAVFALAGGTPGNAQTWPTKPIELIIPWTAGGGVDLIGRSMAQSISDQVGQKVFVSNREGAAGTIGFRAVADATPDGYMLGGGPATPITNSPYLVSGVRYTPDSFDYICQYFENVFAVTVTKNSKFATIKDLIEAAKASPQKLNYGSAGVGTIGHLSAETMGDALKLNLQHVPFRGDAAALPVLLKGDLEFMVPALSSVRGRDDIRVLAVFSEARQPTVPDVPSVRELGVTNPLVQGLNGLFAPKGLPAATKTALEKACATAVKSEAVAKAMDNTGQIVAYLDGDQFRARAVADYKAKGELIRRLGLENK
jgi:tripartite-type tricarboxylate transporter receptor subunit TctC